MKQKFTKKDLKDGMVVTYREGTQRIVIGDKLYSIPSYECDSYDYQLRLESFSEDLIFEAKVNHPYRIDKVSYKGEVLWERKEIKLSDAERAWLTVAKHDGKRYIARDRDGRLYVYPERPNKGTTAWLSKGDVYKKIWSENLFEFITFDNNEPYLIEDLLKL